MSGAVQDARDAARARFEAQVSTPLALPTQWDNQPFVPPAGAKWCAVTFEGGEAEELEVVGTSNRYRWRWELAARLYGVLEDGEAALLAVADSVKAAFRHVTAAGNSYDVPYLRGGTRTTWPAGGGGWWTVEVLCPFRRVELAVRPAGSTSSAASFAQAASTIRARFHDQVEVPQAVPTQYDDQPAPAAVTRWVRFTVLRGRTYQVGQGTERRYRTVGIAVAQVFHPLEDGTAQPDALADQVVAAFRAVRQDAVAFEVPSVSQVGRDPSGAWWQTNVRIPWYTDEVAA